MNTLLVIEIAIIITLLNSHMGCYKFILFRFLGKSLKLSVKPQQIIIKLSPKGKTVFQQMAHVAQMSLRFEVYFSHVLVDQYLNLKDCCVLWLSVHVRDFHQLKVNLYYILFENQSHFQNLLLLGKHSGCRHAHHSSRINYTATINKKTDILKRTCGDCFHKHSLFLGARIISTKSTNTAGIVLYTLYTKVLIKYFVTKDGL